MRYWCWVVGYGSATLAGYGSYIAGYGTYVAGYGRATLAGYGTYVVAYGGAALADDAALRIYVEAGRALTLLGDTVPDQRVAIIILVDRVNASLQHQ